MSRDFSTNNVCKKNLRLKNFNKTTLSHKDIETAKKHVVYSSRRMLSYRCELLSNLHFCLQKFLCRIGFGKSFRDVTPNILRGKFCRGAIIRGNFAGKNAGPRARNVTVGPRLERDGGEPQKVTLNYLYLSQPSITEIGVWLLEMQVCLVTGSSCSA